MPRGRDLFVPTSPSTYPFATLFAATPEECIPQLLNILPGREAVHDYLTAFENRVYVCAFPHLPVELTKNEVDRFLADPERNSRMCPEMLALIFAAIALGAQHSVWDKGSESWRTETIDEEAQRGNVYSQSSLRGHSTVLTYVSSCGRDASATSFIIYAQTLITSDRDTHHDWAVLVQLWSLLGRMDSLRYYDSISPGYWSSPSPKIPRSSPAYSKRMRDSANSLVVVAPYG